MKLSNIPIQQKIMLVILLTSGAVLLLTFAAYFTYEMSTYRQVTQARLATIGKIIATNSTTTGVFQNPSVGNEVLEALQADNHIKAAGLYDANGHLFSRYPISLSTKVFPVSPQRDGYQFTDNYLTDFQPIVQDKKRLGTLYIKLEVSTLYERLQRHGLIAIGVIGLSILMAYGLSIALQKGISNPILSLVQTASIVSNQHDYSVRATKSGEDELGVLTDAFNQMLKQIDQQNQEIISLNQHLEQKVIERTGELELAYEELKIQNDFVETIIDSSVHMIAVLDREMRFTAINKRCEELYGVDRQVVMGRSYTDVFPKTLGSTAHKSIIKALAGNHIHNTITESAVIAGYFETYFIPLLKGQEVYGVLIISHDITRIMEANEKLKMANDQLTKSNQALEQFAYVASHDLQEPLRKIRTFSELLKTSRLDANETQRYLDKMYDSAVRMTTLIKDLLSYSRLSRVEEGVVETNLNKILELVQSDFELLIEQKGAIISCSELPIIKGVPHQLSQLFANLIGNALKFNEQKPVIRITARQLPGHEVEQYKILPEEHSYWEITIADNGIGFDPKYIPKIFTIFQRLNNPKSYGGTGIGLALCKKIVENHGGLILASSSPGQGSTFTIVLHE